MYGTRENICRQLAEQYPAEAPLSLIIWSGADVEALAEGMEYDVSEPEIKAVLERIDAIPEERRIESGVSADAVMTLIDQVKEAEAEVPDVPNVSVPADLLEILVTTAEQALWRREWISRDSGLPVPGSVVRRLSEAARARALLKR